VPTPRKKDSGGQGAGSGHSRTAGLSQAEGHSLPRNAPQLKVKKRRRKRGRQKACGGLTPASN